VDLRQLVSRERLSLGEDLVVYFFLDADALAEEVHLHRQRERVVRFLRVFLEVFVERLEVLVKLVLLKVDSTAWQLGLEVIAQRGFA
jgi:hypothetical protein